MEHAPCSNNLMNHYGQKLPNFGQKGHFLSKEADTGKSLSEALIFASTNPQYDSRLFIVHENFKLRLPAEHVVNNVYTNCCFCFVLTFRTILVHNMICICCKLLKRFTCTFLISSALYNIYCLLILRQIM